MNNHASSGKKISLVVDEEGENVRIDSWLASRFPDQSRTYFQYLIEHGHVLCNGEGVKKRIKVMSGDLIEAHLLPTVDIALEPENIAFTIVYEDDDIIVVDKPSGLIVHPAPGHWTGTFVNGLLYHCKNLPEGDDLLRPGIVHRLDKGTSGVMVAAKTYEARQNLVDQFTARKVGKEYLAITVGKPSEEHVDHAIKRHPYRPHLRILTEEGDVGKDASTFFEVLAYSEQLALVRAKPITGRTHQIRLHLKGQGTPILGDAFYGSEKANNRFDAPRLCLHAYKLSFYHPTTQEKVTFCAELPDDMYNIIRQINPDYLAAERTS
ncbi:RluA family pseudouridine synthase [Simkania negevensis]|uniref:Pseudouridine synthase n=1 Tax=Simkania negevensis TaxID=83561 RepID=A0ABS3AQK9_9BACT|nr:RluA family pseudouridine synthase [Simkania negevensis]